MDRDDCQSAISELYGYLDGELTDERRAAIHAHIDECSPCLDAFDFEADLRAVVSQKCKEVVPDELSDLVRR